MANKLMKATARQESVVIFGCLAAVAVFQLWVSRGTLRPAFFLNDSAMHEQMVRFATASLRGGHFPMSRWYPGLDLGSPQFLHYQGLAATLGGLLGLVVSPNLVFRWSLYLLWSLWPLAIYGAARVFTFPRRVALAAAVIAAAVVSIPLVGYEIGAYMWSGYGIWAQLCASWALPFAWAWTWRALNDRRYTLHAVFFIALTASLHFETGYSAFLGLALMTPLVWSAIRVRVRNALAIGSGALLTTSWITVPLLLNAKWAAINSALVNTGLVRGYGAAQNLHWLFRGQLFDAPVDTVSRFPLITIAVAAGVTFALWRWKKYQPTRPIVTLLVVIFLISFGPTTWGPLLNLLPGHADIYFRRFLLSVHLAGILTAGIGLAAVGDLLERRVLPFFKNLVTGAPMKPAKIVGWGAAALALVAALATYPEIENFGNVNESLASAQVAQQNAAAPALAPILSYLRSHPDGRVYAGSILNWGANFDVGQVQMNIYLADNDIDEVGFVLRTAALMEQPEYNFDAANPSDYAIMGVRYILTPATMTSPVPARVLMTSGNYRLWVIPQNSYFDVVNNAGTIDANKATVGQQSLAVLDYGLIANHNDYLVNWGSNALAVQPRSVLKGAPGTILAASPDLPNGQAGVTVSMKRSGVVVLAASYDPGWTVTVDGVPAKTVAVAPAVVGVVVPAGEHKITFVYKGFQWYWLLAIVVLIGFGDAWRFSRRDR